MAARSARPDSASCTMGPSGITDATGSAPRPSGMKRHTRAASPLQSHGAPSTALRRRGVTGRAVRVATSPIHTVSASSVDTTKLKRAPEGDHATLLMPAPAGSAMVIGSGSPPATVRSESPRAGFCRDGPLVRGSRRRPASRYSGAETSAMDGSPGRSCSSSSRRSGLSCTVGVAGASRMRRTASGGCW